MKDISRNLTMLCDFYELTMSNGYFKTGLKDRMVYFDVFYRQNPDQGGFAVVAGLEQIVEYIQNLHFDQDDINYLRSKNLFDEEFLAYLADFSFTGDIVNYSKYNNTTLEIATNIIMNDSNHLPFSMSVNRTPENRIHCGNADALVGQQFT